MGCGSGPIGFGGKHRRALHATTSRPSPARSTAFATCCRGSRTAKVDARVGRADRRLRRPPAVLRHRARHAHPLRRRLHRQRRRAQLARRADPRVARRSASTTSGRGCRSSTRRVPKLPPEPISRLGGGLVRAAILACEEAEERGRRPSLPARAGRRAAAPARHVASARANRNVRILLATHQLAWIGRRRSTYTVTVGGVTCRRSGMR